MFNRLVNFNNKTEVNGEDLNTMVKKAIKAALEGGGVKHPKWSQHTYINLAMKMRLLEFTALT